MKKPHTKYLILILIAVVGAFILIIFNKNNDQVNNLPRLTFNKEGISLVGALTDSSGTPLGDLYVTYINKTVFTSLYVVRQITGKNVVIYKINSGGFFNTTGKDGDVVQNNFYGFEFSTVQNDYFTLHLISNDGKNVSDDIRVHWNYDTKLFEILRPDFSKIFTPIGSLTSNDGSSLGKIFAEYINGTTTFTSLYIVQATFGKESSIYRMSGDGIFNTQGKLLGITRNNFYGYQIDKTGNDYLIAHALFGDGKSMSNSFTIQWNYQKQDFEIKDPPANI